LACGSLWSDVSRALRPSKHQEIAQLQESGAQPLAFVAGQLRERAGEERDLIRFETHEDFALGRIAGRRQERCGGDAESLPEPCENSGAGLLDATSLELGDRAA
jgi:hypothetical protein